MEEWLSSGAYLPPVLRDFHDTKRIFRIVGEMVARRQAKEKDAYDRMLFDLPNWVSAQIYVVDFFLWFMARRGFTLQRSRVKLDFVDIREDIKALDAREFADLKAMIESDRQKDSDKAKTL
jgi:hypothetical protein